jgi:hypothetical protein
MNPLAEQLQEHLLRHQPYVFCYPCLSTRLAASEKDVREAAQLLLVTQDFALVRGVCLQCRRADNLLALKGPPDADAPEESQRAR